MVLKGLEEESDLSEFSCSGQVVGLQILIQNLLSVKVATVFLFHYSEKEKQNKTTP